jgi:type I restriction enzyme S subunit
MKMIPLSQVATINPRLPKRLEDSEEISFVAMASVSEAGKITHQETRNFVDVKKGFTYFQRGDVLLAKITPCFENRKSALANNLEHPVGFGSTEFHVLRAFPEKTDPRFLYHVVRSKRLLILGQKSMKGAAGHKRVPAEFLENFEIPDYSLNDQVRIAQLLGKVEALITHRKQHLQQLDDLLRSVFLEMFGDPVRNEKGWTITSLAYHGSFKNGLNFGKGESGTSVRYLGVGDFKSKAKLDDFENLSFIELNEQPAADYFLQDHDLLFVRSNGNKALVGRCMAVYPGAEQATYSGFCIRYRINSANLQPIFIAYLFRSPAFRRVLLQGGQGANIQNINQQILSSLPIPIPSKDLQKQFVNIVDKVDFLQSRYQASLIDLNHLYGELSQKVFRGEIDLSGVNLSR